MSFGKDTPRKKKDARTPSERMEASALRILSMRSHTRVELRKKLRQRRFSGEGVEALLDRLAGLGYLDEWASARGLLRRRLESRPMGRRMMEQELRARGVPADVLAEVIDESYGEDGELDAARRAARKKRSALMSAPEGRVRERLLRFLQGRGFPAQICLRVSDEILVRAEDEAAHEPSAFRGN